MFGLIKAFLGHRKNEAPSVLDTHNVIERDGQIGLLGPGPHEEWIHILR